MIIDQLKIIEITDDCGKTYQLKASFKSLKKINKIIKGVKIDNKTLDNFFEAFSLFSTDAFWRLELLPYFIVGMIDDENLTIEYVEEHILGMTVKRVHQLVAIIFEILEIELNINNNSEKGNAKKSQSKKK